MATGEIKQSELKKLTPGDRLTDTLIKGFVARCWPTGGISFGYQYTDKATGKRRWISLGLHGAITVAEARNLAKQYAGQVAARRDPAAEFKATTARAEHSVNAVLDKWVKAHVAKLRSAAGVTGTLANHVRPAIGDAVIYDLKRAHIIDLKEAIAERAGVRAAELAIGHLRSAFVWWQKRDEDFHTPIVEGMNETERRPRDRILTSEEIIDIWTALDEWDGPSCFPAYVKTLFLTACRRCEVAGMHTRELECGNQHAMIGGVSTRKATSWTIPASRYKTGISHQVPLVPAIKKLLPDCDDGYVFSANGGTLPIRDWHRLKHKLDAKIAEIRQREGRKPMPAWTFHDLRRTARTILAATGVPREIAERVLGHVIPGVEGVYNRHEYQSEKIDALTRLAAHVDEIVNAPTPAAPKLRLVSGR